MLADTWLVRPINLRRRTELYRRQYLKLAEVTEQSQVRRRASAIPSLCEPFEAAGVFAFQLRSRRSPHVGRGVFVEDDASAK